MMAELSGYVLDLLRQGHDFALYRARESANQSRILLVAPVTYPAPPGSLALLQREYSLAGDLDSKWAIRPLALVDRDGRTMLLFEDFAGEPLDQILLQQPGKDLSSLLRIAIGIATALGHAHRSGLIHKDVRPANVLVDAEGAVRLTGFGIATRLPRQHQTAGPPEVIAGTLAYMAPEQTGRMNRSIDARSDLYSFGIMFYEMLTGSLPFTASDPMEWVHCHIARQPVSPGERVTLPAPVSAIVMKLLSKTAEERYQTASGLEADLRHCLQEWEALARIVPFPLGRHDASERLLIPEKLYGRERDIHKLLAAFDRVADLGAAELLLVSGYSGIGKSSVVSELHKALVPRRGLFATGKFDQYKRGIPYATLAEAFQSLVRQILAKTEAEVAEWRSHLREAVGPNGQLIATLIPEIEFLIGKQPPVPDLPPQDAQNRFQLVFRRFLAVFAKPEHPLALFLDDLQWMDTATLELLQRLVTTQEVRHLLLVGAYRDNEAGPTHPLIQMLETLRNVHANVHEIVLAPLSLNDINRLLADALHCERERARPLAKLVHEKTAGNPFFAIQFITALSDEGLLSFDHGLTAWKWDVERIREKGFTDNVVDLMAGKLNRLPESTQEVLKTFACLGSTAQTKILCMLHGASQEEIHAALWDVAHAGLVFRADATYTFSHDRVQEAAYALVAPGERAAAHLRIGRVLAVQTGPEELEERIFEIVNQLNRGATLITSPVERERVAELHLIAGKRAKASTAYASALEFLSAGHALLGDDRWERQYRLAFELEFHRSECEFLTGDLGTAEERLSMLSQRAAYLIDRASATWLRVTLYTALDQSHRAVETCLEFLVHVDLVWSPHPAKAEAQHEYDRLLRRLGSASIESLIDLPLLSDPLRRAVLDVLVAVLPPAFFTDHNLVCLVLCRMTNLSFEYGNCDASSLAYAYLGMVLGPHFGDYRAGFRFGKLGLDLVDRGLDRYKARVYHTFGSHVIPWARPIHSAPPLLRQAFAAANEIGDVTYGGFSSCTLITSRLGCGEPLEDVQREAGVRLDFVRKAKFGLIVDIITSQLQLIRTLRGELPRFTSFNDAEFDESRFEQHLESNRSLDIAACWYWIRKLQARFYAGEYEAASVAAAKAEQLIWTSPGHFELAEYHFYALLARAAKYDSASTDERRQLLDSIAAHHEQLRIWDGNCPENFANRAALAEAEVDRIEGRDLAAMHAYERAILSAREHGFLHNEGLAYEVAARFYARRGFQTIAHAYLRNARSCYLRWGAAGKVRQLDERHPQLRPDLAPPPPSASTGTQFEQLDLASMLKGSQAVSSEVGLKRLIEKLMLIALEHAGAERAVLIVPNGEELRVEAEAATVRERVEVRVCQTAVTPVELPESILHYTIRTQEIVLLEDARAANPFSTDAYLARTRCRSVLCLPLVTQARLIALLYLENNLTPYAFTPARIGVLKLLASQAAISLENASLEEKDALLKEVHHRVKNNLQLISSLLNLQASRLTDPAAAELFADSRNRVRSMALVHENLYRAGNFARVPMRAHIENLCAHLTRAYGVESQRVELTTQVDDLHLNLDRAVCCGLIINELVSNALKHAFPNGRSGHLCVELVTHPNEQCTLSVRDDGIGLPAGLDAGNAESLGLQLVRDLADQLHGAIAVLREEGTTFAITFETNRRGETDR